ncbi:MAG: HAD family phosphatase [Armatimonadota bacterium]|nr:HAD family phosphatase [Armatimonadota bacterium]MDW8141864.1 HAD family phosphatase [Armatimonadota bacterium]
MVRAVLFDFDGVLADSERLHYEALVHALKEMGLNLSWEEFKQGCIGVPEWDAVQWALKRNGVNDNELVAEVLRRKTQIYDSWLTERLKVADKMADVIRALAQNFVLAIASGSFRHQIEAVLLREGVLELFPVIVSCKDYEQGKPDPTPFLLAMERLNEFISPPLKPHECLVVEDSPAGIQAARKAGMLCVAVRSYYDDEALKDADFIVDDLKGLLMPKLWEHFQMTPLL